MSRKIMIFFLTLFQDKFVQIGTLLGIIAGLLSPELIGGDSLMNSFYLGFIGWGIGAYLGNYKSSTSQFSNKKKFKVYQGGR